MKRDKLIHADGEEYETPVYHLEAGSGPTAVIVGGMHGNEVAAYQAAELIKCWDITNGELVVIPRANPQAIEEASRGYSGQGDPNRKFPTGRRPTSEWARALWDQITSWDPDYVFDLHRSMGLYQRSPSGVGMSIFPTPGARAVAVSALKHLNEDHVPPDLRDSHEFRVGNEQSGHNPLISHKVGGDLEPGCVGWLVETTTYRQNVKTQRDQLEHAVETLLYHASGGRVRVDDYGHHEQEPKDEILAEFGEGPLAETPVPDPEPGGDGTIPDPIPPGAGYGEGGYGLGEYGGVAGEEDVFDELTVEQQIAASIIGQIRAAYDLPPEV